jgi:radical SAM superfamily enzyme YgiQ (UPF0313 family)
VKQLKALLINPYIYDFAAYSFWSVPLGLLTVGAILRENGFDIHLIDCLRVAEGKRKDDGRGPFVRTKVEKPEALRHVKRPYRRYGMSPEALEEELSALAPPDVVLISSGMTYWYGGVREAVVLARRLFPAAKIVVGGLYPSLCGDHAATTLAEADLIVTHREMGKFYVFIEDAFKVPIATRPGAYDLDDTPFPCFDLLPNQPFFPLLTSFGCPFRCPYCATPYMHPTVVRKSVGRVVDEIVHWHDRGISTFVLYDDSFLFRSGDYAKPLLKAVADLPFDIRMYNPNALNARLLDEETAVLLKGAGFMEVRLGLETVDPALQQRLGGKVTGPDFEAAVRRLRSAGFAGPQIHAYAMAGLPFQRWETVESAITYVGGQGIMVGLAEYTPIPHTELFDRYRNAARYPIGEEPLYQNNALFPFAWQGFREEDLERLKARTRAFNLQNGSLQESEDL